MNLPLPRFTFLIGPVGNFLQALSEAEPCALVTDFNELLRDACHDIDITGREKDFEEAIRLIKPDFLGSVHLRDYKIYAPDGQVIFHGLRTTADVTPFAIEFGHRSCLIIQLGALLPQHNASAVQTIWLPPMEAQLQLTHLERELLKQLAPIEEEPDGN